MSNAKVMAITQQDHPRPVSFGYFSITSTNYLVQIIKRPTNKSDTAIALPKPRLFNMNGVLAP